MKYLLAGLLALSCWRCGNKNQPPSIQLGSVAPAFNLRSLEGGKVSSESLKGRPVVLNFWATWCAPCRKEIPALKAIANENLAQVVGISLDLGSDDVVRRFTKRHEMTYTILMGNQRVFSDYRGIAIPYTLVLDADLKIAGVHKGLVSEASLRELLASLSKDLEAKAMGQ